MKTYPKQPIYQSKEPDITKIVTDFFTKLDEGNINDIKRFIQEKNMSINKFIDDSGCTGLHRILLTSKPSESDENSKLEIIKLLIRYSANINAIDKHGQTPLLLAALHKYTKICQYLLDNGAQDISDNNKMSAVHQLCIPKEIPCPDNKSVDTIVPMPENTLEKDPNEKEIIKDVLQLCDKDNNITDYIDSLTDTIKNIQEYYPDEFKETEKNIISELGNISPALSKFEIKKQIEEILIKNQKSIYNTVKSKINTAVKPVIISNNEPDNVWSMDSATPNTKLMNIDIMNDIKEQKKPLIKDAKQLKKDIEKEIKYYTSHLFDLIFNITNTIFIFSDSSESGIKLVDDNDDQVDEISSMTIKEELVNHPLLYTVDKDNKQISNPKYYATVTGTDGKTDIEKFNIQSKGPNEEKFQALYDLYINTNKYDIKKIESWVDILNDHLEVIRSLNFYKKDLTEFMVTATIRDDLVNLVTEVMYKLLVVLDSIISSADDTDSTIVKNIKDIEDAKNRNEVFTNSLHIMHTLKLQMEQIHDTIIDTDYVKDNIKYIQNIQINKKNMSNVCDNCINDIIIISNRISAVYDIIDKYMAINKYLSTYFKDTSHANVECDNLFTRTLVKIPKLSKDDLLVSITDFIKDYKNDSVMNILYTTEIEAKANGVVDSPILELDNLVNQIPVKYDYDYINKLYKIKEGNNTGTENVTFDVDNKAYIIIKKNKLNIINKYIIDYGYFKYLKIRIIQNLLNALYTYLNTGSNSTNWLNKLKINDMQNKENHILIICITVGKLFDKYLNSYIEYLGKYTALKNVLDTFDSVLPRNTYAELISPAKIQLYNDAPPHATSISSINDYLDLLLSYTAGINTNYAVPLLKEREAKDVTKIYGTNSAVVNCFNQTNAVTILKDMISKNFNLDKKDITGKTPIMYTIEVIQYELCQKLLEQSVSIYKDPIKLFTAVFKEHLDKFTTVNNYTDELHEQLQSKMQNKKIPVYLDIVLPTYIAIFNHWFYCDMHQFVRGWNKNTEVIKLLNKYLEPTTVYNNDDWYFTGFFKVGPEQIKDIAKKYDKVQAITDNSTLKKTYSDKLSTLNAELVQLNTDLTKFPINTPAYKVLNTKIKKINDKITEYTNKKNNFDRYKYNDRLSHEITKINGKLKMDQILKSDKSIINKSPIELYKDFFGVDIISFEQMEYWKQYLKTNPETFIEMVHPLLHETIIKIHAQIKATKIFDTGFAKTTVMVNKIDDFIKDFQLIQEVYENIFIKFYSDFNDLPQNTTDNYALERIDQIITYVIKTLIIPNFLGAIMKEIYLDIKDRPIEAGLDKIDDMMTTILNTKNLEEVKLQEYLLGDYAKYATKICLTHEHTLEERRIKFTDLHDKIINILMLNTVYVYELNSQLVTNLTKYIFPYYVDVIEKCCEYMYKLNKMYENYIQNELQMIKMMILFLEHIKKLIDAYIKRWK